MSTQTLLDAVEIELTELLASPVEEYKSTGSAQSQNVRRRRIAELMDARRELRAELASQNVGRFRVADVRGSE